MILKMADCPPIVSGLPGDRYQALKSKFVERFGQEPAFYARAPGRVNLIGEHIDYCGYGVLPMAIEQDIVVAVSKNEVNKLVLANVKPGYSEFECPIAGFEIIKGETSWHNYFLCGLKGMTEFLSLASPVGMNCLVDGTVPPSAGLSSSSALVCSAALATMHANGQSKRKDEVADMCANCERYIGTIGGGMDQAISFMAQPGTAKKIDFNPLRSVDVTLPDGVTFVMSNCCVEKNKAASNDFNTRVVECRIAAQIIAKSKGLKWKDFKRLGHVQETLTVALADMTGVVKETFHPEPYSKEEVCDILEVSPDELAETSLSQNTLSVQQFKLYDRAMHVFGEAQRVQQFQEVCATKPANAATTLGKLMNDSHSSCRDQYECSCTELDQLVDICVKSGALGSRLTGAGWGGCAVSMVPSNQMSSFLEKVKVEYYQATGRTTLVGQALFATKPGGGAAVFVE